MIGDIKKAKQTAAGLLVVLSLFAASVAACICAHHTEKTAPTIVSCHEHAEANRETDEAPAAVVNLDASDECGCAAPAPRAFSKSEKIKIEKQTASVPSAAPVIEERATVIAGERFYFEKPFYLSDSFYNLKSPRAPPIA